MIKFSQWERDNFNECSKEYDVTIIFPSREIYFSSRLLEIMRFESSNAPKTMDQWLELYSPSEHAKISELENIIYKSKEIFFSLPRALYCGDGIYRNFRLDAFIQRNEKSEPLKLTGNEISSLNAWLSCANDGDRIELDNGKILEASRFADITFINDVTKIEDLERENLILRHEIARRIFSPFPKPLKSLKDEGLEDFIFEVLSENLEIASKIFHKNSDLIQLKNSINTGFNIAVTGLSGGGKTMLADAIRRSGVINGDINLIDTKGWDSLDDNQNLKKILPEFDFVIYVIPIRSRLKGSDYEMLAELKALGTKIIFVLSKIDLEISDTEAGKVIKTPEEKISSDIEALKNEIKNFYDFSEEVTVIPISAKNALEDGEKNSNIESLTDAIKNLSENSKLRALVMRAARTVKILENETKGNAESDLVIKNLRRLISDNEELSIIKIPVNKSDFNFSRSRNEESNILSSLIISMREHGFKGRFFSLPAFNGRRHAALFSAQRGMSMKLLARLAHNLRLEDYEAKSENSWLSVNVRGTLPSGLGLRFECEEINSGGFASDEKILIAPSDYLLKKEDFNNKYKKILKDYVPVVSVDLARPESGLSDLIHSPLTQNWGVLARTKWILSFPDAALLSDEMSIEDLETGIKNYLRSAGLKLPDFFIFENYGIEPGDFVN